MFDDFKQFVASEVCIECKGCCRFNKSNSVWRAKVIEEESIDIKKRCNIDCILSSQEISEGKYLPAIPYQDIYTCSFLNCKNNECEIYPFRPFECQLYPFMLVKLSERISLYAHLGCPYIQENWKNQKFVSYVGYLRKYLNKSSIKKYLKKYFFISEEYSDYHDELDFLFEIG